MIARTSTGCSTGCLPTSAPGQSIIFIATKRDAEALANKLQDEGHTALRCTATCTSASATGR